MVQPDPAQVAADLAPPELAEAGERWAAWFRAFHEAAWCVARDRDEAVLRRLEAARRFIEQRATDAPSLDDIAQAAALSPSHFHRLFRERYGRTPHAYLTARRLERARELLVETELPVTDVCFEVGFESLGSFSTLFRRHHGVPPSRWRRRWIPSGWEAPRPPVPWCFLTSATSIGV